MAKKLALNNKLVVDKPAGEQAFRENVTEEEITRLTNAKLIVRYTPCFPSKYLANEVHIIESTHWNIE